LASAAELGGEVEEAVGDHIEIVLGFDIPGLVRACSSGRLTKAV